MRPIVVLLFSLFVAASASAQPAQPSYAHWADRAQKADAKALSELALDAPAFARVWFYGNVFDLTIPEIPQGVRLALRPKLDAVAVVLADDAVYWLSNRDRLAAAFEPSQSMRDAWLANARAGDPVPPMLGSVERSEVAGPVFYRLLHRAHILGLKSPEGQLHATTARHMAAGRLVITGNIEWWRELALWHGGDVPATGPQDADDALTRTLNARVLRGDKKAMFRQGEVALDAARRRRPDSLYTALVLNLSAFAAGWAGREQAAITLHVQVQQMVRPLGLPRLDAALLGRLMTAALQGPRMADARHYLDQMKALEVNALATRPTAQLLLKGLTTVEKRLAEAHKAGDQATLEQGLSVYFPLAEMVGAPAISRLLSKRPGRMLDMHIAGARKVQGTLALTRGRFDDAGVAYAQAAEILKRIDAPTRLVAVQTMQAEALWLAGQEGQARALATRVGAKQGGAAGATLQTILGGLRLAGGDPAPAFAHANAGLRTIKGIKVPKVRSQLHILAGLALHMAGFKREAATRIAQGVQQLPASLQRTRLLVLARLAQGDQAGALAAVGAIDGVAPAAAGAMRGCILATAGQHAEALPHFKALGTLSQPHQAWSRLEAMICRIHALMDAGDWTAARAALRAARSTALAVPDPALDWRLRVLEGRDYAEQTKWLDAAGVWRQALLTLSALGVEAPARGMVLPARSLAPGDPAVVADALVDALVAASKADRARADVHLRAAMGVALWARQVAAMPRMSALAAAAWRPAEDRSRHRLLQRLAAMRGALTNPDAMGADRARLTQHMRRINDGLTTALSTLHTAAPAWASYLTPRLEAARGVAGGALVVYHFGRSGGHAFVDVDGQPIRHFALAQADVMQATLATALAVVRDPARRPDWAALHVPFKAAMPFFEDAVLAKSLQDKPLWLVPDGPLVGFPIEALVVDPAGPTFVADTWQIRRAITAQAAATVTPARGLGAIGANDKETRAVLAGGAPTPANPASFQADFAARGTQWITAPADLAQGVLSLTGDDAGRLREADLAFGPGGATAVVLSRATAPLDGGAGVRRMAAALHHRGVTDLVWVTGRVDGDVAFGQQVAAGVRAGQGMGEALRAVKVAARAKTPHPHAWARWMHAETLPRR